MKMTPKARRKMILLATVELARKPGGWSQLTRNLVANHVGCTGSLIYRYFDSMDHLRAAAMRHAIKNEYFDLIAQGIAAGNLICLKLPNAFQRKALSSLGE